VIRLAVDSAVPDETAIGRAAAAILAGAVVAFPTDTLYGLAADPFEEAAVQRIFELKGRSAAQALPLVACDVAQIVEQLGPLPPAAQALAHRFWPGPLTLIVSAAGRPLCPSVTGGTGRAGVRVPAHAVARALCRASGRLLTATSANRSGAPACVRADEVAGALPDVDVLLDAGAAAGGAPSTVVDVSGDSPLLVRAGAVPWEAVMSWLETA
jgi:L-threonylcarbamoyladenylate synthase